MTAHAEAPMRYEHGTHAAYVLDRCRCDRCRQANKLYERDRARLHRAGLRVAMRAVVVTVLIGLTITYLTAATTTALILNHTTRGRHR